MAKPRFDDSDYDTYEETKELSQLEYFVEEGYITEVLYTLKSGKEATVYCCRAHPRMGVELLAAKIYRSRNNRNFKNEAVYQEGRLILDQRVKRAVQKKTRFGRGAQSAIWQNYEYETLQTLFRAGASVPQPYVQSNGSILMEFVGDTNGAAPLLNSVTLEPAEARRLFDELLADIRLWLSCNYVHADLSAFNILYWRGRLKIIDFPQAVDPRFNPHAADLLARDLQNVCRQWSRYGVEADATSLAKSLWTQFYKSQL